VINQRENSRRYYLKHRETLNKKSRAYYWANQERERERNRKYERDHPRDKLSQLIKATRWAEENPEKFSFNRRKYHLKRKYGITIKDFEKMHKSQKGKCLSCRISGKLVIDHNHKTGKVRGLLCRSCNQGLGMFQDSIFRLKKAIIYLQRRPQ